MKKSKTTHELEDSIKVRVPKEWKTHLAAVARTRLTTYSHLAREAIGLWIKANPK